MATRVGIDTGGTFTDLVGLDEATGELVVAKWPSSPGKPAEALFGVVRDSGLPPDAISFLVLGTTVGTNALLERRGANVIYLTTRGFEDILFIQRMNRRYHYSLEWTKPLPFVERRNCLGVRERVNQKGQVLEPLSEEALAEVGDQVQERLGWYPGEEVAIAVCFLFSYINPVHELQAKEYLATRFPRLAISVSHEVAPIWREYERGTTVTADAYVKPLLSRYLDGVRESLTRLGLTCPWAIMKSNGGHAIATAAEAQPVNCLLSGLSGGIIGGKYFGELAGETNLVTLDMGGTSCDVGVVRKGKLSYTTDFQVEWGMPVSAPFVDLTTIGAGGGSIAWIDKGGFLKVGPQSAGAAPGPVCYDKGGEEVTVTDANLVLGRLDPGYFLGGKMTLNKDKAEAKVAELGRRLNVSPAAAAQAVVDIANENMANAIRVLSIDRGLDPRDFALVAFGGAGPLHATAIARQMRMPKVIIPVHPGLCSAFGAVIADLQVDKLWSKHFRSSDVDAAVVDGQFRSLVESAIAELREEGYEGQPKIERIIGMRYAGQNYEQDVHIADGPITAEALQMAFDQFHRLHEEFYGYSISGETIEMIRFGVTATGSSPKPTLKRLPAGGNPHPRRRRPVYFRNEGFVDCPVYAREHLPGGALFVGPAIVEEVDSTILIESGQTLRVDEYGVVAIDLASVANDLKAPAVRVESP
ncbi:MAG: hydantoinase/oxoprolinase family protein [Chloroflexota bacterium]